MGVIGQGGWNGVQGTTANSSASGVWGENTGSGYGVGGQSATGDGVHGEGYNGVHGKGSSDGVLGEGSNGVHGKGSSDGVLGEGYNGVHGEANSDGSGVWGNNSGAGYGVGGQSTSGIGVFAQGGFNGVQGTTANSSASGVWGENTGAGYGVGGKSASGIGIYGIGTPAGQFDGDVVINGGNLTMNRGDIRLPGADCAEQFDIAGARQLDPGTVAVIDEDGALRESSEAYDRKVAGVVSGAGAYKPGIVLGGASREDRALVAVVGKVYCKVDARHAPIELGDLLTTSPTPGHAMRASDPVRAFGAVIGKALRPMSDGCGLLPMLVALQ